MTVVHKHPFHEGVMSIAEAYEKGLLKCYCVSPSCSRTADRDAQYCTMHRLERGETVICKHCRQPFRLTRFFPCVACACEERTQP